MQKNIQTLLNNIVDELKAITEIEGIILYGSYARNEASHGSDIDLLIIVGSSQPKRFLERVLLLIGKHDKEGVVSPRLTNLQDYDAEFLEHVMREGKVLFGKFVLDDKKLPLKPYILVSYNLSAVAHAAKVRISRRVHGYTSKKSTAKKNVSYAYRGLKDEDGVILLSDASLLLPEKQKGFLNFLEREHATFVQRKVWM